MFVLHERVQHIKLKKSCICKIENPTLDLLPGRKGYNKENNEEKKVCKKLMVHQKV